MLLLFRDLPVVTKAASLSWQGHVMVSIDIADITSVHGLIKRVFH